MRYFTVGLISLISVVPALALGGYIYVKDRGDKEPLPLLSGLFGAGAASFVLLFFLEGWVSGWFDSLFARYKDVMDDGRVVFTSPGAEKGLHLLCAFVAVALLEEGVRWVLLFFITRKNVNFNYLFDGVIYSAFLSLGFAVADNLRFAVVNGWDQLLVRAVTSVPAHLLFGILMGFFYSLWHTWTFAAALENELLRAGKVKTKEVAPPVSFLICSILVPLVVHGVFSYISLGATRGMRIAYYVLIAVLYVVCFVLVYRLSTLDNTDRMFAKAIVQQNHPEEKLFEGGVSNA